MKKIYFLPLLIFVIIIGVIACKKNHKNNEPVDTKPPTEAHIGDTVKVNFPVGSIGNEKVSLKTVNDNQINQVFADAIRIYEVEQKLPYAVVLNIGKTQALNDSITMEVKIPEYFKNLKKPSSGFEIFAQVYQDNEMETLDDFVLVESSYDKVRGIVKVNLPRAFFTNERTKDKTFEAIIMIGTTPGENAELSTLKKNSKIQAVTPCKGQPLSCPLGSIEECTEWYPKLTDRMKFGWRIHPVLGYEKFHKGIDFPVNPGTPIYSARNGKILWAIENHPDAGNFIEIKDEDGSVTRYLHLSEIIVKKGNVTAGQLIGKSGRTGRVTGAHLHFEYILYGKVNNEKTPVDPAPCIENQNSNGSITVRDNGNWADDAFEVSLDGVSLGKTSIGASNTIAANNLRPGTKPLTLKCFIAPDNEGTYEVILNDGLTFSTGGVRQSGVLGQGQSVTWDIVIPKTTTKTNNINFAKPNSFKEKGIN